MSLAQNSTAEEPTERLTGVCKWFDSKRGYGFVTSDHDGVDVFVHQTAIRCDGFRKIVEGQPISFGLTEDTSGRMKATDVIGGEMPPRRRKARAETEQ